MRLLFFLNGLGLGLGLGGGGGGVYDGQKNPEKFKHKNLGIKENKYII